MKKNIRTNTEPHPTLAEDHGYLTGARRSDDLSIHMNGSTDDKLNACSSDCAGNSQR